MTVITHFPPEILSSITQALDGFDIAHLWLTGDVGFRVRLESGGVTRFKLKLRQERTRKWPTLISRFRRLEYLSIKPQEYFSIWFRDVNILGVSPTLKHLKMDFTNSEFVLLGIPYVVEDLHPDPTFSPATEAEIGLSPLPIADHFKELQTLALNGKTGIPHILIPLLPQTLHPLRLSYKDIPRATFAAFPPHLTILELPNLTYLERGVIFPLGIVSLSIPRIVSIGQGCLPSMPKTLATLTLGQCKTTVPNIFDLLPSNLTSFAFSGNYPFPNLNFERIPQSLRHLDFGPTNNLIQFDFFPPCLQTLIVRHLTPSSVANIRLIPPTLAKLVVRGSDMPEECLKYFSSNLRSLCLRTRFPMPESPYSFMSTLEKLVVTKVDLRALRSMPRLSKLVVNSFDGSDFGALRTLSCLRQLHILSEVVLDTELLRSLPDSLQEVEFAEANDQIEPNASQYLPRSLLSLTIGVNTTISDPFIQPLPPQLTELSLQSIETLYDDAIRLLPRTLVSLTLPCVKQITDDGIRHLPASLTDCRLEGATELTDQCVPFFPRHLTRLYLDHSPHITNKAMPHFPRTLVFLDLLFADNITIDCLPDLPPLLEYFRVTDSRLADTWKPRISPTSSYISSVIRRHKEQEEAK